MDITELKKRSPEFSELLMLINSLPDVENHIYMIDGKWEITTEWLVGSFCGRSFMGDTIDHSLSQLSDYLNQHIGHDSWVGRIVGKSGWPNLQLVQKYLAAN